MKRILFALLFCCIFYPIFSQEETGSEPLPEKTVLEEQIDTAEEEGDEPSPVFPVENSSSILEKYFPVEGLSQWQYQYDISNLEEGVYNLIVRGTDSAGNQVESAAVDIRVDPDSDYPGASLTYPTNNMVVSGDLNILGSAQDDDGIATVEIRLGDDEFIQIRGGEFWSYELKTGELPDGEYSLTVRATDINGLTGNEKTIHFHIDRRLPELKVTSHSNGDLVSGRITIEGTVEDLNGVESLRFSLDGGNIFESARLSGKAREGSGSFSLGINTNELNDGPGVIWFEGTDVQGSSGQAALLLYVDNSPPVLDFLYPLEGEPVNGRFSIMGRAFDQVGLAGLEYNDGGEENLPIGLEPGNPFWKVDVDFSGEKKANLDFILKDIAGNTKKFPLKLDLDWEGDLPYVELYNPLEESYTDKRRFQGVILDDDGPAGIFWTLDKGEEKYIDTGRFFDILLEDLSAGKHTLTYRAKDNHGVEGAAMSVSFNILPESPVISLDAFLFAGGGEEGYAPGTRIRPDEVSGLRGTIQFDSGAGSASIIMAGGASQALALKKTEVPGRFSFTADLPEPLALGYYEIEIRAADKLQAEETGTYYFWMEDLSVNLSDHGFYTPRGEYVVDNGNDLILRYVGYPLTAISASAGEDFLEINREGDFISFSGKAAGGIEGLSLTGVSDRGTEFTIDNLDILCDLLPPVFSGIEPESGGYRGRMSIKGQVSDDSGRPEVFYRIGSGEFQAASLSEAENGWEFSFNPDTELLGGAGAVVTLLARDQAGRETIVRKAYQIQQSGGEPPPVKLFAVSPEKDGVVFPEKQSGNHLLLSAAVTGLDSVSQITWALDGGDPRPAQGFPVAAASVPVPEPGIHTVSFRAEYGEGKSLTASQRFTVAPGSGVLVLSSVVTGENRIPFRQGGDFSVGPGSLLQGSVSGGMKFQESLITVDDGEPQTLKLSAAETVFNFQIPLRGFAYGRHDILFELTDSFGRKIEEQFFFFVQLPAAGRGLLGEEGLYPLSVLEDERPLFLEPGSALDFLFNGRGIESAGLTIPDENFSVSIDDDIIRLSVDRAARLEGAVLEVKTIDGDSFVWGPFDVSSDTAVPDLTLTLPVSGNYYQDILPIQGVLSDDLAAGTLEYSLQGGSYTLFESEPGDVVEAVVEDGDNDTPDEEITEDSTEAPGAPQPLPGSYKLNGTIDISPLPDGPVRILFRSSDLGGNSRIDELFFVKEIQHHPG